MQNKKVYSEKKLKAKNIYIVPAISFEVNTNIGSLISLSWLDGQVGVFPVFTNKKKALKYLKSVGLDKEELLTGVKRS